MSIKKPQRGYTLLEMIVSLGIFSLVMVVVTGAYLTLISLDRQARANNQLVTSLSFAVESMARNMRTGTAYACNGSSVSPNCVNGGTSISFVDSQGQTVTYFKRGDGTIGQCTGGCSEARATSLTDPLITVQSLTFYVKGVGTGDTVQPQVIFVIKGTMRIDANKTTEFTIQTAATQRFIDI
ncbi:type II secretion system GspH family protein [Patescibacteria group bacterium]|nr:type II secretion system GspH family protein [Patescibacteria group bacterium]MBU1500501.1 type II secretion system GspH family protein [Patescibacteria group bacterium]MBU2080700.1 type II secretion system GspH family protein [Patescibacteria group bacterium]MBU2123805.1 type II secretion system GspH family protein [Patescibacteria group bacterium]MBU2194904.1 type II secretion system GspH family protein [Patescibacteria group bacterium]